MLRVGGPALQEHEPLHIEGDVGHADLCLGPLGCAHSRKEKPDGFGNGEGGRK
tara:strand:+ start:303 stop:461 length:159 start_codon:yes stop_codon:yes gene_type:complete